MEITGELHDAFWVKEGEDPRAPCLRGMVHGDTRGRFWDGEFITTSTVMETLEDNLFKTRYSVYRVVSWRDVNKETN